LSTHAGSSATSEVVRSARGSLPSALCSLAGVGYYLPQNILTNQQLSTTVDTSHEWIVERTGIHGRHCADSTEATSDLAFRAGSAALADAGLTPAQVDLILFATSTPDTPVPATACYLQQRLGCGQVPAMDIGAGCSGFGTALHMAAASVKSGMHKNVLVIGADCLTRITNYADRQSCILFGDGAGAAVVSSHGFIDVVYSDIGADGSSADLIRVPAGGSRTPASVESVAAGKHTLEMRGREVFKSAVRHMCDCIRKAAAAIGVRPGDFDLIIPHQANARIIEAIGAQLEYPASRLVIDMADTGNTAAASIPVALARARQGGLLKPEQLVAVVGFGAGIAWACQVLVVKDR
jgi:3-oxoacyl-[acyl-carrier-protein] synthase-3